MPATYLQAEDKFAEIFTSAWNTQAQEIAGTVYVPKIIYEGVQEIEGNKIDQSRYWCRLSSQMVLGSQATLQTNVGSTSGRRYNAQGLIFVQVFGPVSEVESMDRCRQLAYMAMKAFRSKPNELGIIFRNFRIQPLSPENGFTRLNVVGEYEYDEIA